LQTLERLSAGAQQDTLNDVAVSIME